MEESFGKNRGFLTVLRNVNFKSLQMICLEYLLNAGDVIGVLPTGYGKSMLFHLLPYFIPVKSSRNIVLCPLNAIIDDNRTIIFIIVL